eukprot:NODE_407_length_7978_cov_0.670009.p5 type:complete len:103 gc:universal NODE_407_length_7978_cov_0.670009:902-1210(+)
MTLLKSEVYQSLFRLVKERYFMMENDLKAGPSFCGLPQGPLNAVPSTLNFGSPKLESSISFDLVTVCWFKMEKSTYSLNLVSRKVKFLILDSSGTWFFFKKS